MLTPWTSISYYFRRIRFHAGTLCRTHASVLNAAARLIARIARSSHISTFMTEQLHRLPLSARNHFKIIFLVYKAFLGLAPTYLCNCKLIMRPLSAISDRPLRSLVRNDLLVPRSRTSASQQCAF